MSINTARLTQRVLNTLADEGVKISRPTVESCVSKATSTAVGIQDEDMLHDKLVSVFLDTSDLGILGDAQSEHAGGIFLTTVDESFQYGR